MEYLNLTCTRDTFRPSLTSDVRWLDWEADSERARALWSSDGHTFTDKEWEELWAGARSEGYRYCAVIEGEAIASVAAVWRYSDEAWEAAAVYTAPTFRRRGYAKSVVSFVTAHILDAGRLATCHTDVDNLAMARTAEAVGFREA